MFSKSPETMTIKELSAELARHFPQSGEHVILNAELIRRQTIAQLEATQAQKEAAIAEQEAAKAATETAHLTAKNVRYMFWSVIAAAVSAVITAISVAYNVFNGHGG